MQIIYQIISAMYKHELDKYPEESFVLMSFTTKNEAIVFLKQVKHYYDRMQKQCNFICLRYTKLEILDSSMDEFCKKRLAISEYPVYDCVSESGFNFYKEKP